jgi:hypothetical protein
MRCVVWVYFASICIAMRSARASDNNYFKDADRKPAARAVDHPSNSASQLYEFHDIDDLIKNEDVVNWAHDFAESRDVGQEQQHQVHEQKSTSNSPSSRFQTRTKDIFCGTRRPKSVPRTKKFFVDFVHSYVTEYLGTHSHDVKALFDKIIAALEEKGACFWVWNEDNQAYELADQGTKRRKIAYLFNRVPGRKTDGTKALSR